MVHLLEFIKNNVKNQLKILENMGQEQFIGIGILAVVLLLTIRFGVWLLVKEYKHEKA